MEDLAEILVHDDKNESWGTSLPQTPEHVGKIKFGEEPDNYAGSNAYVNALNFGIQIGAGVKVSAIVVDLRFGLGLTDPIDKRDLNTRTLNRSLQLTVGFPLGGRK